MFIWGKRMFGLVDYVAGYFYVVTQFFHIWFIPLIPLKSYLVIDGSEKDGGFRGVEIPINGKSVMTAYLRAILVIAGIMSVFYLHSFLAVITPIFCGLAFWGTYRIFPPDEQKIKLLAQQLNQHK